MKSESGINNRWALLEQIVGENIKHKFSAYGWWHNEDLRISKDEHWSGWWNDCFEFVTVFPLTQNGKKIVAKMARLFTDHGYDVNRVINSGISVCYKTMTAEESYVKAKSNLLHGGRMSD